MYNVYGTLLKDYIYMGDRLIAEYNHVGARYLYYTPDQINSTRVVTDGVGNVVYWAVHDPYGGIQQANPNNTYDPQLKFSGKERDVESGLDYFWARYYDRSQYRFISVGPVTMLSISTHSKRTNLYVYCGDNPVVYVEWAGSAYLFFNSSTNKISVYNNAMYYVGDYNASNYADNPWPEGIFYCKGFHPTPDHSAMDSVSFSGFWEFDVSRFDRTVMGIHGGQWGQPDSCKPPRFGWVALYWRVHS